MPPPHNSKSTVPCSLESQSLRGQHPIASPTESAESDGAVAEAGPQACDGVGDVGVPVLRDAAHGKMDDRFGHIIAAVSVESTIVGPESGKLKDAEEDTEDVNPGLHSVLSFDEPQKFQSIKGGVVKEASPDLPDRAAVDGVNDTVIISSTDAAMRVLSKPVLGVPTV